MNRVFRALHGEEDLCNCLFWTLVVLLDSEKNYNTTIRWGKTISKYSFCQSYSKILFSSRTDGTTRYLLLNFLESVNWVNFNRLTKAEIRFITTCFKKNGWFICKYIRAKVLMPFGKLLIKNNLQHGHQVRVHCERSHELQPKMSSNSEWNLVIFSLRQGHETKINWYW